jgi:hypothetical protein
MLMWMADAGTPPRAGNTGGSAPEAVLARCHADIDRVIREAVRAGAAHRRTRALLSGLSTACLEVLSSELRAGAADAASLRGIDRSRRLLEAARAFVPERCLAPPDTMAGTVESRCPPPEDLHFAGPLPRTLDTGSYVYALALRNQLRARGAYDERAERWVSEFLLRSALEGEERGAH